LPLRSPSRVSTQVWPCASSPPIRSPECDQLVIAPQSIRTARAGRGSNRSCGRSPRTSPWA
jgi:hypothetical protein